MKKMLVVKRQTLALLLGLANAGASAQPATESAGIDAEALQHFQALVRMDTQNPPGNEKLAADYVAQVLEREGIPVQVFALEANRPNVVARLAGNGSKRPLLIMGHTDTVNVDPAKWQHPPFGAAREGGYIYGRGTVDDKDTVTAGLMTMLLLKRNLVALDRDVIFLAESGEEGTTRVGIQFMVNEHFDAIDAEYCLAETGNVIRIDGEARYGGVQTAEKFSRGIDLIAHGVAGHGSVPLESNALARLARAIVAITEWQPPVVLNATTRAFFSGLAEVEQDPSLARRYRDLLSSDSEAVTTADASQASMLRTSISPTILQGGYRNNVIPSEARDARRAHAPGRRPGSISRRARARDRRRPSRSRIQQLQLAAPGCHDTRRRRGLRGHRTRDRRALWSAGVSDDGHGRHRHGVLAREGRALLRHRAGNRSGGRRARLRRAQRSGTHRGVRALSLRSFSLRPRRRPRGLRLSERLQHVAA